MAAPESLAQRQWEAGWDHELPPMGRRYFSRVGWMIYGPMVGEVGKEKDESSTSFSLVAVFSRMWSSLGADTGTMYLPQNLPICPFPVSPSAIPVEHIY